MLNKKFGAAPVGQGTALEGIREKLERSGSTASKTERQASSLTSDRRSSDRRSARRQRLVAHLHAAGPRPCLECLLEVAAGGNLDDVLEAYRRIPVDVYRALGADRLPIDHLTIIKGGER